MTTSYPAVFDALNNPASGDSQNSITVPHSAQHANANDAIEAIEAELGLNPRGGSATVKARLDAIEASIVAIGASVLSGLPAASVTLAKMAAASIGTAQLVDDSISAVKLQANSVTTVKIADLQVTNTKIADATITNAKIADATITSSKLSGISVNSIGLFSARPVGTAGAGFFATDRATSYLHDGTNWVITLEPVVTGAAPAVSAASGTITTLGTRTQYYQRSNGIITTWGSVAITTNGTGAVSLWIAAPIAAEANVSVCGSIREGAITGYLGVATYLAGVFVCNTYNNTYPGGNGTIIQYMCRYPMVTKYS